MKLITRSWKQAAVVLSTAALLTVAGCTGNDASPKAELEQAMASLSAAKSYTFNTTAEFKQLQLPNAGQQPPSMDAAGVASLMNGLKLTMDGVYQKEPMRTDANVKLTLPGNLELTLPMIMTSEKIYIQVPSLPTIIPKELVGKYVVLDMAKLAAEQGQAAKALDPSLQQRLVLEAGAAFIKPFDEKTYFKSLKADEAGLPADLKPDSVVQFLLDSSNKDQAITTAVEQAIPAVLDVLLGNEAYLNAVGLDKAKAEENKKQLAEGQSELSKKVKQQLKLNQFKLIGAVKDGKLAYQNVDANVEYSDPQGKGNLKLVMNNATTYSKMDEAAAFTQEIPTDAISVEELMKQINGDVGMSMQ
ncbi:hypothetical protein [Paenibacillus herberti]|uniref:Lipoprotein n=1 Tax=Paenibacillus herberti TaxID=1619309 RepID=A0A229NY96_9BACL|nr:hypothetical protein [Paenibacillus herberti]OXM14609.1 hypothetical protein CGZ75_16950 [Paenibacillus herberti]